MRDLQGVDLRCAGSEAPNVIRSAIVLLLTLIALPVSACASPPPPVVVNPRPLGAGELWVPVANWFKPGVGTLLCAGGGFIGDYRLHGSPTDARVVWMTDPHGLRQEVAWPVGYSARFRPELELLNETSRVVGREDRSSSADARPSIEGCGP